MVQGSLWASGPEKDSAESTVMVLQAWAPGRPNLGCGCRSSCLPILPQLLRDGRSLAHCTPGTRRSRSETSSPSLHSHIAELYSGMWSPSLTTSPLEGKYSRKACPTVVKCSRPWYPGPGSGLGWLGGESCRLAAAAAAALPGSGRVGGSLSARGQLREGARAVAEAAGGGRCRCVTCRGLQGLV